MEIIEKPEGCCKRCGATFQFDKSDIKNTGGKGTPYLECPGCGSMLDPYDPEEDSEDWKNSEIFFMIAVILVLGIVLGYILGKP